MLWLYRLLFLPAMLALAPSYLARMRRRGGYREKFSQRFGAHRGLPAKRAGVRRVWLQAVSVGEMLAIGPLLEGLTRAGDVEVYLTTTTSTGYRVAADRYRGRTMGLGYFPIDWWPFSRRAWRSIAPDLVILTEGERWPEHIHQAGKRGVPVVAVNARMSDRSFRRLRTFGFAVRPVLDGITRLLACSEPDAARFRELGVPGERIQTTGNLKLDVRIPRLDVAEKARLRRELGLPADGLVLMGSSTWPGEEAVLLEALRRARGKGMACSLLVVPRHAERRREIEPVMRASGLTFHFRSQGAAAETVDVAVGDTTGEMRNFLQLADVVFVGKSLPPHTEGQTPVESAALGRPLVLGPGMANFRAIARELVAQGAAVQVADAEALKTELVALLRDAGRRAALAAAAQAWQQANVGAVERTLAVLREMLGRG